MEWLQDRKTLCQNAAGDGELAAVQEQMKEPGHDGFVSATYLVDRINTSLQAAGGGSVEIRRCNRETGEIFESMDDQKALSRMDFQMRAGQLGRLIQVLTPEEKLEWAMARKEEGNNHFTKMETDEAIQRYLDATVGLDFGSTQEHEQKTRELVQIPVLTNLAACYARKREWGKVVQFCDQALELDPYHIKALVRRGRARIEMDNLREAREDLLRARELVPSCAQAEMQLLRKAMAAEKQNQELRRQLAQRMLSRPVNESCDADQTPEQAPALETGKDDTRSCWEVLQLRIRRFLMFRVDPPVKFE